MRGDRQRGDGEMTGQAPIAKYTVQDADRFICITPAGALSVETVFLCNFAGDMALLRICCEDNAREVDDGADEIVWPTVLEAYAYAMRERAGR